MSSQRRPRKSATALPEEPERAGLRPPSLGNLEVTSPVSVVEWFSALCTICAIKSLSPVGSQSTYIH